MRYCTHRVRYFYRTDVGGVLHERFFPVLHLRRSELRTPRYYGLEPGAALQRLRLVFLVTNFLLSSGLFTCVLGYSVPAELDPAREKCDRIDGNELLHGDFRMFWPIYRGCILRALGDRWSQESPGSVRNRVPRSELLPSFQA